MKRFVYTALFCVTTATTAACGGGGDDRLVSSLSDQDFIDVCEGISWSDAELRGLAGLQCMFAELFAQDGCMDARLSSCISATFAEIKANPEPCEAPEADDPIRECDATVDQVLACSEARIAQLIPLGNATCADLENEQEEPEPAACVALEAKCPGLAD